MKKFFIVQKCINYMSTNLGVGGETIWKHRRTLWVALKWMLIWDMALRSVHLTQDRNQWLNLVNSFRISSLKEILFASWEVPFSMELAE
jgi:hypothetical protein